MDYIRQIINELQHIYAANEARNIALEIVQHISKASRTQILLNNFPLLTNEQQNMLKSFVERLKQHEPVQYVVGNTEFYGLPFKVDKRVLIPRPETEELVEWILEGTKNEHGCLIDLCTGSGCIAIALAKKLPLSKVFACDLSGESLDLARENSLINGVNVDFFQADVLAAGFAENLPQADVIVSNPPYVLEKEKEKMQKNVLDYEPAMALFVPDTNSLLFYEAIAKTAFQKLKSGGALYVEINQSLGNETVALFEQTGFTNVQIRNDLYGNPRMVKAEK
jgi:release factor glutamine methyltransferase